MTKYEKILNDFLKQVSNLKYTYDTNKYKIIIDEVKLFLSEIVKIIGDYGVKHWEEKINKIDFGCDIPARDSEECWRIGKKQLLRILQNIKKQVKECSKDEKVNVNSEGKMSKIFISHSSTNKKYGDALRDFISGLGISDEQIIYTSHSLHKIPNGLNIFDYLRDNINKNIFVIFLLSESYFCSPACMNEMGAAWVIKNDYINIYIPNFNFNDPKYNDCVIDKKKMGIILDGNDECRSRMIDLKKMIQLIFDLNDDEQKSNYILNTFIKAIKKKERQRNLFPESTFTQRKDEICDVTKLKLKSNLNHMSPL